MTEIVETPPFWKELPKFQRAAFPKVPIFVNSKNGGSISKVWARFYTNQLVHKKRVEIAYSSETHVSLFIKNVKANDFSNAVQPLLDEGIHLGEPGGSWQSIKINVPYVDVTQSINVQKEELSEVFKAAQCLYAFFIKHEETLLAIPTKP